VVSLIPSDSQVPSITELPLGLDTWIDIFHQLNLNGVAQRVFANVEYRRNQDGVEIFCLDRSQSAIYNEDLLVKFEAALREFFGYKMNVQVFVSDIESETPAGYKKRLLDEANALRVTSYESDSNVQSLLKKFSGFVVKDSIIKTKD
tara:strand:- start:619 stop:1059 length:441 start_codon:yes stop_codon:yes gene_type:complete